MADVERVTKRGAGYGFDYLADVSLKIPRSDVEAIGAHVNEHLQLLAPGTRCASADVSWAALMLYRHDLRRLPARQAGEQRRRHHLHVRLYACRPSG